MLSSVGRPKEHDERTRAALLVAAEGLVAEGGPDALSIRLVAERVGTTTRAVYSLFGSKDGLIAALASRAFRIIEASMNDLPVTDDPARDLVDVGVLVFRRFVREHPALFRIAFQRIAPELMARAEVVEARNSALPKLLARVQHAADAGVLGTTSAMEGAIAFNALCEGLANAELRGSNLPILPGGHEDEAWRTALESLVRGFSSPRADEGRRPASSSARRSSQHRRR